jgi:glycosyltransferase involved in cell wall biosynthesis
LEPNISVVLLCYRSGEEVRGFVERLQDSLEQFEKNWEIILVGNYLPGISDPTPEVVNEIASNHPRIKAVVLEKKGMMGWDMRSGLRAATGKNVAVIDGDGQMPLEDVARVYKSLIEGDYDMVKTYRVGRKDGYYRKFLSFFFNIVFRVLFPGSNLRDVNSKPKILKREYLDKMDLKSDDWFADAEIMIIARRLEMKVLEVPTTFNKIFSRPSFVKPWAVFEFLMNLLAYRIKELSSQSSQVNSKDSSEEK